MKIILEGARLKEIQEKMGKEKLDEGFKKMFEGLKKARKLLNEGKISKITFNRFRSGINKIFNPLEFGNNIYAEAFFKKLMDGKKDEFRIDLFWNAYNKINSEWSSHKLPQEKKQ